MIGGTPAKAAMEVSFSDRFWPSVEALSANEARQVVKAVNLLSRDPFSTSLNLKPVRGDGAGRKYTCRANEDIRILVFKQAELLLLERAGHHEPIYELAGRVDLVHNGGTGRVVVLERPTSVPAVPVSQRELMDASATLRPDGPGLFDHWGDADLAEAGLASVSERLRQCRVEDELLGLGLDDETLGLAIDLLGQTPEQWRTPALDDDAAATGRLRQAIADQAGSNGISPWFSADEMDKLLSGPIEDWMVFLHPDQRAVVGRHYEGPARVRGSAGTGKTVVALHRAATLVRRFESATVDAAPPSRALLFTTFIKSLPPVLERLYQRLPQSRADDPVEFRNIDSLAHLVCTEAGERPVLDPRKADSTFGAAVRAIFADLPVTREYLRDEVTQVIKGRGITTLDEYLALERTGRRTRFPAELRRRVWALREAWDAGLAAAGIWDFPDVVQRARDLARRRPAPRYRAAIIDEAQDLTLVGLQLVRALVNGPGEDRPDGLLIVGDGAQRIYAGGFTLAQAGVEVRGRTTVLRTNYRNTVQVMAAAMAVAGREDVDDLGEVYRRGDVDAFSLRAGIRPVLALCASTQDEADFIVEQVRDLTASGALELGDIAVAVPNNKQVEDMALRLSVWGIPTIKLADYRGSPVNKVKLGTHFRIKGLEFKVVFLPYLGAGDFPRRPRPGESPEEHAEQLSLSISQLFVAMTRARDGLFILASGEPSPVLLPALDCFEVADRR